MKFTDEELLEALKERFQAKVQALHDYQRLVEELGNLNQKLQESEKLKSQFLSNIRNEINNPFAAIMGLSRQLINLETNQIEHTRSMGRLIYEEAFDLDFQLRNIFAAAEAEAGEVNLQVSRIKLDKMFADILASFEMQASRQQIDLRLQCSDQSLTFCTDAEKMQLIVSNLISNAIKFSHESQQPEQPKELSVSYRLEDNKLRIAVSDQGIGIAEKNHQLIFDRFRQLDAGMTKVHHGHGLGLSVVKALLELMQGEIRVESQPNQGSTFIVILPSCESPVMYSSSANEFLFEDGELF
ncbi:MAG: sensor histidine kinase [Cyclobacteriaceae bacterium]